MDATHLIPLIDRTYSFSLQIISLITDNVKVIPSVLSNQLLRAGTSVGANITEAKAAASRKEFANFYRIALKSNNETIYWLRLLKDSRMVSCKIADTILQEAEEIGRIIGTSINKLRDS